MASVGGSAFRSFDADQVRSTVDAIIISDDALNVDFARSSKIT